MGLVRVYLSLRSTSMYRFLVLLSSECVKQFINMLGMVDLNTNLTVIIYYRMYPTLFRRIEQTWKRLWVGLRTDDNIPKNASSICDIVETILWMLLLLHYLLG